MVVGPHLCVHRGHMFYTLYNTHARLLTQDTYLLGKDTKAAIANVLAQAEAMRATEKELGEELRRAKGACVVG